MRWLTLSWNFSRALAQLQSQMRLDLLHFTDAREALFSQLEVPAVGNVNDTYAADISPLAYYRQHYGDAFFRWLYYQFVRTCEHLTLPRFQVIMANSHYTAQIIARQYGLAPERLHVCHKSIALDNYASCLSMRQQVPPHPPRILFVGGNYQRKGVPTLIRAAALILPEFPEAEFRIVGSDTQLPRMEALCRAEGVATHFRFLDWQPQADLARLYAQADVFVMPSLMEAFGVVFLEAMAAGLPVIGTRVGGIPELIEDGRNGLLVEPADPVGLAEALQRLLHDRALQDRLRQAGLQTARQFSVDRMMACTYPLYQMLTSNRC